MSQVGAVYVDVVPRVRDFRADLTRDINASLGRAPIAVPVQPTITPGAAGAALTWQKIAGGAVVPVPVAPTVDKALAAATGREIGTSVTGGVRGALLGLGGSSAARALGIGGAAAGLFVFGQAALAAGKSAATLEQNLDVLQQVSGATDDQMDQLAETARQLGADVRLPGVSSADAAATMVELAKAGLTVDDVLKGTRGTLELATAANLDFATSSELAADALNEFQLPGSEATRVADLFAGAANAAQGDVADFGIALAQSGAVAHQAGISLQETVVFLTELAKAGISGSDAGTSLRTALLRLIAPTTEAKAIFRELGIEITDAQGNVRTDVFEQLRQAMDRLNPATRNAALATIFGSDAVRAAAVFVRDGAAGHEQLARQVERSGQASETAAARTKGLAGSVGGLSSNVETLGTDIGTLAVPALTDLADAASVAVQDVDFLVVSVGKLGHEVGGIDLGPFGSVGHVVKSTVKDAVSAPFQPLHAAVDVMRGDFKGAAKDLETLVPGVRQAREAIFGKGHADVTGFAGAGDRSSPQRDAAEQGRQTGEAFTKGLATGIRQRTPEAILSARRAVEDTRRTLREVIEQGQQAVEQTIRQGDEAIQAAALEAKQNLTQITSTLASQVTDILDSGPLAQRIEALQARLDRSRAGLERTRLRGDLQEARRELERAEAAIAGGGPRSAEQAAAEADFLRPFQQRVKDAQASLEEFNVQGNISKLTARLEREKDRAQRALDDVVARFNAGLVSSGDVVARVAAVLRKNVGPMRTAGKDQGFAFRQSFLAEIEALNEQVTAITVGPQTRRTGAEPRVVSPAEVAAQAAADVKTAREQATRQTVAATRDVEDAVKNLTKATEKASSGTQSLLQDIRDQRARPPARPSSTVPRDQPRPRTGGR